MTYTEQTERATLYAIENEARQARQEKARSRAMPSRAEPSERAWSKQWNRRVNRKDWRK